MRIKLEKRTVVPKWMVVVVSILSVLLSLPVIAVIFKLKGVDPILAYKKIFTGAFGSTYGLSETVVKAIPLILCGVGLAIPFRALIWNIGAEGQLLIGAIVSTGIALKFPDWPAYILLPTMFIVGFIGGAVWGMIPGFLRAKLRANEVITTLMLNYIAYKLLEYLVYGPWKGKEEWGFPYTSKFSPSAQLPRLFNTRIHYPTLILGLVLAILTYILIYRTKWGYEIRVVGENPEAANYAGISHLKVILLVMALSGGFAGLAGVGEVAGIQHRLRLGISPGYGYTAIIVAWLGRLHPLAIVLTSLLFGGLLVGGDMIQVALGLPFAAIDIFNGVILFFVLAGDFIMKYKIRILR